MAEPTPGPWIAKGNPGPLCVTDKDSRYVVDRFILGDRTPEENLANARLIAIAPYLLDVCKQVSALLGGWREVIAELDDMQKTEVLGKAMWACLDQIDETKKNLATAIAKAKGD